MRGAFPRTISKSTRLVSPRPPPTSRIACNWRSVRNRDSGVFRRRLHSPFRSRSGVAHRGECLGCEEAQAVDVLESRLAGLDVVKEGTIAIPIGIPKHPSEVLERIGSQKLPTGHPEETRAKAYSSAELCDRADGCSESR
jgi:hypothetical protein